MALSLAGFPFNGNIGELKFSPPTHKRRVTSFFGVDGVSEIDGGIGEQEITTDVWLFNNYTTDDALTAAITAIQTQIGLHGTLTETGTLSRTFEHVTFHGFHQEFGPIYSPQLKWFVGGILIFSQLGP